MATGLADAEASDRKLDRRMSVWQLFFLSMGGIIGSGWLFAALTAASQAGPAAIISWVIGGILVLFVAFNYAEISGMLPRSGAIVRYPHLTHGGYTGFILGWTYFLSAVTVPGIEAEAVVTYASSYIHEIVNPANSELTWPYGILFGVGLMIIFLVVNYVGIRFLSQFNSFVTGWKFVIPILTFILLFIFDLHTKNFGGYKGGFVPLGWAPVLGAVATSGIVFSFLGFRQALDYGGEARNPQRDIPIATIASVLAGIGLYVLLQVAFIGAIKWGAFGIHAGDWAALKHGSAAADAPFYIALKSAGPALLGYFATILLIDAFVSPGGTGVVYMGTSARTVYGLSIVGYLPRLFQSILERFRIPWIALIASFVVGCLFFLPLPSWYELVGIITGTTVLTYIMGGIGVHVLRRTAPDLARPFRLPAAGIVGPIGFIGAMLIVYWSDFSELAIIYAAVFMALPVFVWFYAPNKGWINRGSGLVLGVVFTALWIIDQRWGQWVLVANPSAVAHPAFPVFYFTMILLIAGFTGALYYMCNEEGREAVRSSWWLIYFLLAIFGISYYGAYGPAASAGQTAGIPFPADLLVVIMLGLLAYGWAIHSGYETEDIKAITMTGSGVVGGGDAPATVTPPSPTSGFGSS
ncbi:MAG: APC family permease [Candidatus Dormibacteria bacterium]